MLYWAKLIVQFINERITVRHIDLHDRLIRNLINVLHQGADAIAVGDQNNAFSKLESRSDLLSPEGQNPT